MLPGETGSRGETASCEGWFQILGSSAEDALEFSSVADKLVIIQGPKQLETMFQQWEKMELVVV